MRLKIKKFH